MAEKSIDLGRGVKTSVGELRSQGLSESQVNLITSGKAKGDLRDAARLSIRGIGDFSSLVSDTARRTSALGRETGEVTRERGVEQGQEFAREILGDGLGRLRGNEEVESIISRFQDASQGLDAQALQAEREKIGEEINRGAATSSRELQGLLARSGVRGGIAGRQLTDIQLQAQAQKAGVERDLFLKQAEAKRQGLRDLANVTIQAEQFDLGQEAAEKNILLGTGVGFAQLGSAELSADKQAELLKASQAPKGGK